MLTQQQLHELAAALHAPIARLLREPETEVSLKLILSLVDATNPEGPSRLRVEIRVRGEEVSPEQDARVQQLLAGVSAR